MARQRLPLVQLCADETALALRMGLTKGSRRPLEPIKRGAGFFSGIVDGPAALAVTFAAAAGGAVFGGFFAAVAPNPAFFGLIAVFAAAAVLLAGSEVLLVAAGLFTAPLEAGAVTLA